MSKSLLVGLTVHIPAHLHKALKMAAVKRDERLRILVIEALEEKLEKIDSKKQGK